MVNVPYLMPYEKLDTASKRCDYAEVRSVNIFFTVGLIFFLQYHLVAISLLVVLIAMPLHDLPPFFSFILLVYGVASEPYVFFDNLYTRYIAEFGSNARLVYCSIHEHALIFVLYS